MDLRVLRSFITICKLGNITRASEALFISQPALTRQLQELEEEVGTKLLNRSTRNLTLTESGYLFLHRAEEILALANQAKRELSEKGDFLRGIVRIGVVESSAMDFLTEKIGEFTRDYSHVCFEIYSADSDDLKRSLDENKLDICVLLEPVESAKYIQTPIPSRDRWGLVVREIDISEGKTHFTYEEVSQLPLILPRRYIVLDEIPRWLHVPEKKLKGAAYHNLPSNALSMVTAGFGSLLCVEGSFINRGKPGLKFLPVKPERAAGHVAVRKKNRSLFKAAEFVWDMLKNSGNLPSA